jgi:hypothetical protein
MGGVDRSCGDIERDAVSAAAMRELADGADRPGAGIGSAQGEPGRRPGRLQPHSQRFRPSLAKRFGFFELTDEHGGETLDRIAMVEGEIRIADRAYLQPDRIAKMLDAGADIVVRAPWRGASWRDASDKPADLIAILQQGAATGVIDQPSAKANIRYPGRPSPPPNGSS